MFADIWLTPSACATGKISWLSWVLFLTLPRFIAGLFVWCRLWVRHATGINALWAEAGEWTKRTSGSKVSGNTCITTACALIASIGNAHDFKNGRQLAAWLGLTPSQYSSGGKSKLGRITKAGDSYLRTLLVQGARSVLIGAGKKTDSFSRWVCSLVERRGYWRVVVAIAAKNARLCWASLH